MRCILKKLILSLMLIIKVKTAKKKELFYDFNARGPVRCCCFMNGCLGVLSICHKLMFCSDLKGNQPLVHSSTSPPPLSLSLQLGGLSCLKDWSFAKHRDCVALR